MDKNCYVTTTTTQYALRLNDGRVVPISSASSMSTLLGDSKWQNKMGKRMTVTVTGTMDGEAIRVDSIR
jgi:hypothetical protein